MMTDSPKTSEAIDSALSISRVDGAQLNFSAILDFVSALLSAFTLVAVLVVGWYFSPSQFINPEVGLGYSLGVAGSSMMAVMLIYPLRKRIKFLRGFGSVKIWFRAHMMLGVIGPTLIVLHTNFSLGSINSQVALFSMLIVAFSGLIGRYLYRQIHHGLYGHRASLRELQLQSSELGKNDSLSILGLKSIGEELDVLDAKIETPANSFFCSLIRLFQLAWETRLIKFRLMRSISNQLDLRARESKVLAQQKRRILRSTRRFLNKRLRVCRRILMFRVYERLFSLWHILHIPLFEILVVAVLVHIYAVHAY